MIDVTTYGDETQNKVVSIDIDKIALVQRQTTGIIGRDFTAIFMVGMPPFQVVETRWEVRHRILEARALRASTAALLIERKISSNLEVLK